MIGTVLIVAIPWIVFGLSLGTICLRLRRFRRFGGRSRNRASRPPPADDKDSSANIREPAGNAHYAASLSSSEVDCPAGRGPLLLQRGQR
jgi:hypothetical protein